MNSYRWIRKYWHVGVYKWMAYRDRGARELSRVLLAAVMWQTTRCRVFFMFLSLPFLPFPFLGSSPPFYLSTSDSSLLSLSFSPLSLSLSLSLYECVRASPSIYHSAAIFLSFFVSFLFILHSNQNDMIIYVWISPSAKDQRVESVLCWIRV